MNLAPNASPATWGGRVQNSAFAAQLLVFNRVVSPMVSSGFRVQGSGCTGQHLRNFSVGFRVGFSNQNSEPRVPGREACTLISCVSCKESSPFSVSEALQSATPARSKSAVQGGGNLVSISEKKATQ